MGAIGSFDPVGPAGTFHGAHSIAPKDIMHIQTQRNLPDFFNSKTRSRRNRRLTVRYAAEIPASAILSQPELRRIVAEMID